MAKTDIVVSGAGMAGMTLAVALAKGGLSVALIDRLAPQEIASEGFDGRVSALAYSSVRMLRALGLWEGLEPRAQPINDILVNEGRLHGRALPFSLHFDHREIGEPLGALLKTGTSRKAWLRPLAVREGMG